MRRLLETLVLCAALAALGAALVPRDRRAVNPEEEEERLRTSSSSSTTSTPKPREICAPQTPCAWSTYRPGVKVIEVNITNSYCVCSGETACQVDEDDTAVSAYVYRCRAPASGEGDGDGEGDGAPDS